MTPIQRAARALVLKERGVSDFSGLSPEARESEGGARGA
jgi:hypothetical protein